MFLNRCNAIVCGLLCVLSSLALAQGGSQVYDESHYHQHHIRQLQETPEGLDFLVLGDWGRNGHYQQRQVAMW